MQPKKLRLLKPPKLGPHLKLGKSDNIIFIVSTIQIGKRQVKKNTFTFGQFLSGGAWTKMKDLFLQVQVPVHPLPSLSAESICRVESESRARDCWHCSASSLGRNAHQSTFFQENSILRGPTHHLASLPSSH